MLSDRLTETAAGVNGDAPVDQSHELPLADLTQRIAEAGISETSPFDDDPAYEAFFDAVCRALHRSTPRHVIVVGEPGVGEGAVIIELARRGLLGRPPLLSNARIRTLDCRSIAPGQAGAMLQMLLGVDNVGESDILCLEGTSHLFRLFAAEPALLRWVFSRARSRILLLTTPREFDELLAGRADVLELFSTVDLFEPSRDVARRIVRHFAFGLESNYRLEISDDAIASAVALADTHILHERLPHKAVRVLRAICDDLDYDRSQRGVSAARISADHVIGKISELTGVPTATLAGIGEEVDYRRTLGDRQRRK